MTGQKWPAFLWWDNGRVTQIRGDHTLLAFCDNGGRARDAHASWDLRGRPLCKHCQYAAIRRGHYWLNLARGVQS